MNKEFDQEKKHLKTVITQYENILKEEELRLYTLTKIYKNNNQLLDNLILRKEQRIHIMKNSIEKPYFARIDFKDKKTKNIYKCYIGKVGVLDKDNNIITVDWRAPIASMYYDSNIGNAYYISQSRKIEGELLVKRQFEISNKKLISYQDVDTVSNDDILKPYLGVNSYNRIKNIISSIQKEQNDIIRKPIENDLIIQGVAGSGKTTVALHRIAYLVYNNKNWVESEQYMVIGPNKFFLNYISDILPDLDVCNASQVTFEQLTKNFLNENFKLSSDERKIKKIINKKQLFKLNRLKVTLIYKNAINKFMKEFEKKIIPNNDFYIRDYKIVPLDVIKKIYYEIDTSFYFNIEDITEKIILRIKKYISDNFNEIIMNINEIMHNKFIKCKTKEEEHKVIKEANSIKKELSKQNMLSLKKYFFKSYEKILNLYSEFVNCLDKYIELDDDMKMEQKFTLEKLKNKVVDFEDLSALLYLKYKMSGNKQYKKFKYAVIDEAQDLGEFNFYVLTKLMPNCRFSVFGDLAQSIYGYRSIKNWNVVLKIFKNSKIMYLLKSYRTTVEIMNEANKILRFINLLPANPVIRHGHKVEYLKENNIIDQVKIQIKKFQNKGFKSIAIISKTTEETNKLSQLLNICNISNIDAEYTGGVCAITCNLAKGLEFDAVIISNASNDNYDKENEMDMKLLYVAMTRALHRLCLIYKKDLVEPLK